MVRKLLYRIFEYQQKSLPVWYPARDPLADPALHGNAWRPWKEISADINDNQNKTESTASTASYVDSERQVNNNLGNITNLQLPNCCLKYILNSSSFYNNVSQKNADSNNDTNITYHYNSSSLEPSLSSSSEIDCCRLNTTAGQANAIQVRDCCLRSTVNFADLVSIQTARDKKVYDVLHKVLNISDVI